MWHVEPFLGNDREATIQQLLLTNGSAKKHACMATREESNSVCVTVNRTEQSRPV
jgi:hypothetical protein